MSDSVGTNTTDAVADPTPLPTFELSFEGDVWQCPITGREIAKTLAANLQERELIYELANKNEKVRKDLMDVCSRSILYWINAFVWTYVPQEIGDDGRPIPDSSVLKHQPFLTWQVQDHAITELVRAIEERYDALIDKSRDMGASWIVIIIAVWCWLFKPDVQILFTARVQDDIDKADPKSMMWKMDYLIQNLPSWMLPCPLRDLTKGKNSKCRQNLLLINPGNRSIIRGEATTAHIGRGDRKLFIAFDEMAAQERADEGWKSAASSTQCRIANSTPVGPGTEYSRLWQVGISRGSPKVVGLYYFDHPQKGRGREWVCDKDGLYTGTAGRWFWWTPFYEYETGRNSVQSLSENLLADHTASGDSFFSPQAVTQHMLTHAREPRRCILARHDDWKESDWSQGWYFEDSPDGNWYVWCELEDGLPVGQDDDHVMFLDPSHGRGSANSACPVMNLATKEFVAELVDPYMSMGEIADEVCVVGECLFGRCGSRPALLGWELNGPGEGWHRDLEERGYWNVYFRRRVGTRRERESGQKEYGWRSGRIQKRQLLNSLRSEIVASTVTIHSEAGLKEMLQYVFFDDGSVGPGTLRDEASGAREAHGDRVIGYAGCVMLSWNADSMVEEGVEGIQDDRPGSIGAFLGVADTLRAIERGDYMNEPLPRL